MGSKGRTMEGNMERAVGARPSSGQTPAPHDATTACGQVLLALDTFLATYTAALPALCRADLRRIVQPLDSYARAVDDDASRKAPEPAPSLEPWMWEAI
jgi:hypothetical protein